MRNRRPARFAVFVAVLFLTSLAAQAKPKEKVYDVPPAQLFGMLEKAVHSKFVITFQDKDEMLISFHTGVSLTSNGFECNASVEKDGAKSKVLINPQKVKQAFAWGAGDRIAEDIFKLIDKEAEEYSPQAAETSK